jgi:hypothetical protein
MVERAPRRPVILPRTFVTDGVNLFFKGTLGE